MDILEKKGFKTITEVAQELKLEAYVIRYWETQFIQLKPIRYLGKRFYSKENIDFLCKIKELLYKQGYTIKGAKQHLDGIGNLRLQKVIEELQSLIYLVEQIINRNVA